MIMGLVLPPKLAPIQVVIIPIYKGMDQLEAITEKVGSLIESLRVEGIAVKYDDRDTHKPGFKFNEYEFKGVPVRMAIGPRDLENGTIEIARRDTLEKETIQLDSAVEEVKRLLENIQKEFCFQKAFDYREAHITEVDSYNEFKKVLDEKGGFISAHWDGFS